MSKSETKRAVAYLRVSNLSQVDGHSLDAQDRLFHQLCDNRDWEAARVYREEGASAHSESIKPTFPISTLQGVPYSATELLDVAE